jgi:hypothetical protein
MDGCAGGVGIDVYEGGFRRRIVSATMTRTGRVRSAATDASPPGEASRQFGVWRPRGSVRRVAFALKQFRGPDPAESARSVRPESKTTFWMTRLRLGRHGGPGSGPPEKSTKRAVGKTAMP